MSSAATGASAALTAIPAWATALTGALLGACALASGGRRAALAPVVCAVASGLAIGIVVPSTTPPPSGGVVTRSVANTPRGDLFDALGRLDADPASLLGSRISVSGEWTPANGGRFATVSRRVMSCCAADAVDVGFDVALARGACAHAGTWVRVEGVVGERIDDGDVRYVLEQSMLRGLEDRGASRHCIP